MKWTEKVTSDFLSLKEIKRYSSSKEVEELKQYALEAATPAAHLAVNKINAVQAAGRGEIMINPMDVKDLADEHKAIQYDPAKLDKANPSDFLGEKWFSTHTDYPDTTFPVNAAHFERKLFVEALEAFDREISEKDADQLHITQAVLKTLIRGTHKQ